MAMDLVDYNDADVLALLEEVKRKPSEQLESDTVEFKEFSSLQALHNEKHLTDELCALANHRGGVLIVGVRDSSNLKTQNYHEQLVGFERVDTDELEKRVRGRIQGSIRLRAVNISFESKNYVALYIVRNLDQLVVTATGKTYMRHGRESRPMSPDEIKNFVKAMPNYDWSAEIVETHQPPVDLMDPSSLGEALRKYTQKRNLPPDIDKEKFLESVGITKNGLLTRGGLLFLGRKDKINTHLGVFEFRFTHRQGVALKLNQVWADNLWRSVQKARQCLESCVVEKQFQFNNNTYKAANLDADAFNEAFLNAIVHRDYGVDGMTSVDFNGQELAVTNPGSFYGGITVDNIVIHEPRHRNKALADIFMNYGLVDRAGMGVRRMSIKSLVYGRSFPVFEESLDSVKVSMQADDIKPAIFALTHNKQLENLYPHDLTLLNLLHEKVALSVADCIQAIHKLTTQPWPSIQNFVKRWALYVTMCASSQDVFLKIRDEQKSFFSLDRVHKTPSNSDKLVKSFVFLKKHGRVQGQDIAKHVGLRSSNTSRFLKSIQWVEQIKNGKAAHYELGDRYRNL